MKTQVEGLTSPSKNKLKVESSFDLPASKDVYSPNYAKQQEENKVPPGYYSLREVLPSCFVFYGFDDLHIRPFNSSEIITMNYAHLTGSLRPIAQVINNALHEDINCLAMTYPDVKQMMAWLRLNSYHKNDFTYDAICNNKDHKDKIISGELKVESLVNQVTTRESDFIEEVIDHARTEKIFEQIKNDYGLELVPETFAMYIELAELLESMAPQDEDGKFLLNRISAEDNNTLFVANYAKYLSPLYGETLKEKIEFFSSLKLPADIYVDIREFVEASYHNIKETLTTECRGCGAPIVTNVTFEPRSFFP